MSQLTKIIFVSALTSGLVSSCFLLLVNLSLDDQVTRFAPDISRQIYEYNKKIKEVYVELKQERDLRLALASQLDELITYSINETLDSSDIANTKNSTTNKIIPENKLIPHDGSKAPIKRWFSEQALFDLGLNESDVEELKWSFEEMQLAILEAKPQQRRKLQAHYRHEMGDDNYDNILYASGHENRVVIEDIPHDSLAIEAGIQVGDVIYSYGGERVFDPSSFYLLTKARSKFSSVDMQVFRSGNLLTLMVSGGVLGTTLNKTRLAPSHY